MQWKIRTAIDLVAATVFSTTTSSASDLIACAQFEYYSLKIIKEGGKVNEYRDFDQSGRFELFRTLRRVGRTRYESSNQFGEFWIITSREVEAHDRDGLIVKRPRLPC